MIPIENWTRVRGRIETVEEADVANHLAVHVVLDTVESVEDYPDRLDREAGENLTVLVRHGTVGEVEPGAVLECRVRRAGLDRVYAHPRDVTVERS